MGQARGGTPSSVGLREQNRLATHGRLIHAARQLLAERGGFTAEEISERAGVSRATYFNYFPGKDDLLRALYVEHMDALERVVDSLLDADLDTTARVTAVFTGFAAAIEQFPSYLRAVTAEFERTFAAPEVSARHNEMFNDQMIRILAEGAERGEVRTDHSARFLAQMIGAIYVSTIRYWRQEPETDVPQLFLDAGGFAAGSLSPTRTERKTNA